MSETAKVRPYVTKYCRGTGVDVGCGTEKIVADAVGVDLAHQYDRSDHPATAADVVGGWEQFFAAVREESLDYVYSSHLLEDYSDIEQVLREWMRALRPHGYLVLYLPIESLYRRYCQTTGQSYNCDHQQCWTGSDDFLGQLPEWTRDQMQLVEASGVIGEYSFYVVLRKSGRADHAPSV